jgi:hypothetical protein
LFEDALGLLLARFVVSALGIGLSKYGLAGVEASMLMEKKWTAANAMQLMAHCDKVSVSS